jgi:hypothetical protein
MNKVAFIIILFFCPLLSIQVLAKLHISTIDIPPYGIETSHASSGIYFDIANLITQK